MRKTSIRMYVYCSIGFAAGAAVFPMIVMNALKAAESVGAPLVEGAASGAPLGLIIAGGVLGAVAGYRRGALRGDN